MPTAWTRLMDLKPSSFRTHLKLRLIRSYDLKSYRNSGEVYARECIFHDNEGNRVLAIFHKEEITQFGPALKEGNLYRISNPSILANNKPNLASHRFKLSLTKRTTVAETYDQYFPTYLCVFKPFPEVMLIQEFDNTPLFDVIGVLILDQPTQTKPVYGKETLIMDIILENLKGQKLSCTLWGDYAQELMNYVQSKPQQPVITIIQFCKAGKFNGTRKVSTFYNISKLFLEQTLPEIHSFKERYLATRTVSRESLSLDLSSCSVQNSPMIIKMRTIEQIMERKEAGRFWICGCIAGYENIGSWYYTSCKGCPKKKCPSESSIPCVVCKTEGIVLRYRLKVQVVDDTGILNLVLWDKHCIRIFWKKAEELLKKSENMADIPTELEDILERKMMFEIEVSKTQASLYDDSFSVCQVSTDRNFIEKYSLQTPNREESVSDAKNKSCVTEEGHSSSAIPLKESKTSDIEGIIDVEDQNTLCGVKRDLLDDFENSSAEGLKKMKASIKVEKI